IFVNKKVASLLRYPSLFMFRWIYLLILPKNLLPNRPLSSKKEGIEASNQTLISKTLKKKSSHKILRRKKIHADVRLEREAGKSRFSHCLSWGLVGDLFSRYKNRFELR